MKLRLKNIGIVRDAEIEINGITVIGGENNTGKSTVSKALYTVFDGFCDYHKVVRRDREQSIASVIRSMVFAFSRGSWEPLAEKNKTNKVVREILDREEFYSAANTDAFRSLLLRYYPDIGEHRADIDVVSKYIERIQSYLSLSEQDILSARLDKIMQNEFSAQMVNAFSDGYGEIKLWVRNKLLHIDVTREGVQVRTPQKLHTRAIYIDDPFAVDEINQDTDIRRRYLSRERTRSIPNHRDSLVSALYLKEREQSISEQLVTSKKLDQIYRIISGVCKGRLVQKDGGGYQYLDEETRTAFDIQSLSTGLKTFVILKQLLLNGAIEENGTIILDEPEIHLHPEWQLVFAELIVLLYREFGMHILLNTHSPYFLRAIQVYAAKYAVADKCNYYLAEKKEDGAVILDVSDNVDRIFTLLAEPFQKLEDLRWQDNAAD